MGWHPPDRKKPFVPLMWTHIFFDNYIRSFKGGDDVQDMSVVLLRLKSFFGGRGLVDRFDCPCGRIRCNNNNNTTTGHFHSAVHVDDDLNFFFLQKSSSMKVTWRLNGQWQSPTRSRDPLGRLIWWMWTLNEWIVETCNSANCRFERTSRDV